MESVAETRTVSKTMNIIGWVVSILPSLVLLMSGSMKFIKPEGIAEGMEHVGWSMGQANMLGILEVGCTILYLIPQTAVIGAVLLTAFMGGAVATHLRIGEAPVMQVIIGMLFWLGIYLREPRLWPLLPLRK
jgi:uncharacterized membrane protein YphA (DoxX/SURF4 family)